MIWCNSCEDIQIVMGQYEVWGKVHSIIFYLEGCWLRGMNTQNPCGEEGLQFIKYILKTFQNIILTSKYSKCIPIYNVI